jgi:Bacterial SH3 domain
MKIRRSILFFCLLGLQTAFAQIPPFFPDELAVSVSTLHLRRQPDKSGKVLEKLRHGERLQFLEAHNNEYVVVDSVNGMWLKVRSSRNNTGYVFSPFVAGVYNLYFENSYFDQLDTGLNWYGLYARDSFADEIRPVQVRTAKQYNEMAENEIEVLKTDQKESSKFLISSIYPLKKSYAGPLGVFTPAEIFSSNGLHPGSMLPISTGQDRGDTTYTPTWVLAATGCAEFRPEDQFVLVRDYRLDVFEPGQAARQNLTMWFRTEEGLNPNVLLIWYGDLDKDGKPDALLQDCPEEMNCRVSLFLSSKAVRGEYLHKVCEYRLPVY